MLGLGSLFGRVGFWRHDRDRGAGLLGPRGSVDLIAAVRQDRPWPA
jgi:hypothetical protein